ncbi:MAG: tetratricopeptide repeat protein, partial [Shewanella sp.]
MAAFYFSTRYTYLLYLFIVSFFGIFSTLSNASTKQTTETQPSSSFTKERQVLVSNQLIGVMYTNQQMQLETVKEQQKLEFERLQNKLSKIDDRIDKFQSDLDGQIQKVEMGRQEIATVSKRIDDSLIYAALSLDRFGLGITVGLAIVGFVGYFSFAEKTKREAKNVAKQWFESHSSDLQQKISALEAELTSAKGKILEHVDAVGQFAEESKIEIQRHGVLTASDEQEKTIDLSSVVKQRADFLKDVPINSYKYDDWNSLAYASYSNGKFEDAAFYWLRASEEIGASSIEIAMALYNRGVAQSHSNQPDAAIISCDEVVRRFGDANDATLNVHVAMALVNKGGVQGQLNQLDAAVHSYDEVVSRFGDASEVSLKGQVARALVNKGAMQEKLHKLDAAVDSYEEVIRRFGDATEFVLKEAVARALVNKGTLQGKNNKFDVAMGAFDEILDRFGNMTELEMKEQVAKALVHKGIIQCQQNQLETAIGSFEEVVQR